MEMKQELRVSDVLASSGEVEYTKVPIVSNRTAYKHNEDLDLHFKKTNRIINLNDLKLIFKFVKGNDANLGFPYCVQDLFSCTSLRLNGNECLPNYRNDGRHVMTNFLRTSLRRKGQVEQPLFGTVASQATTAAVAQSYNLDAFKFQQQLYTGSGTPNTFIYQDLPVCDIIPELRDLGEGGMLDLSATELQITLKMSDKSLLQYRNTLGGGANSDKANVVVELQDMTVFQRTFKKSIQQPLMQQSVMRTMIQYTDAVPGSIQDFRVSVPHKFLSCVVLFIQPKSKVGATANTTNYVYTPPTDSALFSHTNESLAIQIKDIYVEYNNLRYKQNAIPFSDKDQASYLNGKMAVEIAFPNHQLNIPFVQWIFNKHAYIIPINPLNVSGSANTDQGVVNVHIDFGTKYMNGSAMSESNLKLNEVQAYFLVNQDIIGDRVER